MTETRPSEEMLGENDVRVLAFIPLYLQCTTVKNGAFCPLPKRSGSRYCAACNRRNESLRLREAIRIVTKANIRYLR